MNAEHLDAILKTAQAKADKEGWHALPEGGTMTLHVAHGGASLTISRVEAVRIDGPIVYGRTPKRELYAVARDDIFAIAVDAAAATGQPPRRAGFV
jgi:hypothetical protein